MDHRDALPKGYRLDHYTIDEVIGHGGFGITYRAQDTQLQHWVAMKEYLPSGLVARASGGRLYPKTDEDQDDYRWGLERFLDEARTLVRFRHRNIVRVSNFIEANGTAYMIMDLEEGVTLEDLLSQRRKPLEEAQIIAVVAPLLDGLTDVHAVGFLHRDIKPANVFIRRQDETPVLLDFGSARQALIRKSQHISDVYSNGYTPFEMYQSQGNQGAWTDIYALGAVMYKCATGRLPPDAPERVKNDPYVPVSQAAHGRYSAAFCAAIDCALATDENARPKSIGQFAAMLGLRSGAHPVASQHGRFQTPSPTKTSLMKTSDNVKRSMSITLMVLIVVSAGITRFKPVIGDLALVVIIALWIYVGLAYLKFRIGRKFGVGQFWQYLVPIWDNILLCQAAGISVWWAMGLVAANAAAQYMEAGVGQLIFNLAAAGIAGFIFGTIARRLGQNFWLYLVLTTVLLVLPSVIMLFDVLYLLYSGAWMVILASPLLAIIPSLLLAFDKSVPVTGTTWSRDVPTPTNFDPPVYHVPVRAGVAPAPLPDAREAMLTCILGPCDGQKFKLGGHAVVLGRGSNADIKITHGDISRSHASIQIDPTSSARVIVTDLDSANGVFYQKPDGSKKGWRWSRVKGQVVVARGGSNNLIMLGDRVAGFACD
ncbi:MAG: protein kinase [Gammaproteobacteria bacterium]|nr:protein kinase [Gammaproteobacteria bacterium]MCP5136475.1 protein kinase [Gammaproteobacteria bacterium]